MRRSRTHAIRARQTSPSFSLSFFPPFPSLFPPKAQHAHVHTLQTDSRLAKRERKFGLLGRRRRRRGALAAPLLLPTAPMLHVEFMNSLLKRKRKFPNKPKRAAAAAAAAQTMKRWRWKPRSTVQYIGRNVDCLPCSYLSKISSYRVRCRITSYELKNLSPNASSQLRMRGSNITWVPGVKSNDYHFFE